LLKEAEALEWLKSFEISVKNRDFAKAQDLYDSQATLFGTVVVMSQSTDDYKKNQWALIWNTSKNFKFTEILRIDVFDSVAIISTMWENTTLVNEEWIERSGRASLCLIKANEQVKAIHSHFSLSP
jgi:AAA15 family ATPase/GTPase